MILLFATPLIAGVSNAPEVIEFKASQHFVRGLAGFAGHQFDSDNLFESLLAENDAENIFLSVIEDSESTPAALAYSFCGLKKLKSKKIKNVQAQLAGQQAEVAIMRGDVMKKEPLNVLISSIMKAGC